MSLDRVDFPNPAPVTDLADWDNMIGVMKFNALGTFGQAWWDFSGNTIKQGVRVMVGGVIYLSTTATTITGTPSDYVKITPAGATASASYVANLTGVTWNSVYNHYEDVSGNVYLFYEAKASLADPKTEVGAFAKTAYMGEIRERALGDGVSFPDGVNTNNAVLKTKVIEIGSWDMDAIGSRLVSHGISDYTKIRSISVMIRNDAETILYPLSSVGGSGGTTPQGDAWAVNNSGSILLMRVASGVFDNTNFNDAIINRGWVTVTYQV